MGAADGFGAVGIEDVHVLLGVVGQVAFEEEPVVQDGHGLAHVVVGLAILNSRIN